MFANDHFCLVGNVVDEKTKEKIQEVLGVPVHTINICGTPLVGVFIAGNNKCIIVPDIAFESELKKLRELNIPFKVISTKLTAFGNNMICTDTGVFVNSDYSAKVKKMIRQALGVILRPGKIANIKTVGSISAVNAKACITHIDASDADVKYLEEALGVKVYTSTINLGNPFIGAGLCCNKNGFVIGNQSTGVETTMVDEYLGFLD
jgi:translation initiation factor 6